MKTLINLKKEKYSRNKIYPFSKNFNLMQVKTQKYFILIVLFM